MAAIDGHVWVVDRATFRRMIAKSADDQKSLIVSTLRGVPLMENLTEEQLTVIAECVHVRHVRRHWLRARPTADHVAMIMCTGVGILEGRLHHQEGRKGRQVLHRSKWHGRMQEHHRVRQGGTGC